MTGLDAQIEGAGYGQLRIIAAARLHVEPGRLLVILGSNGAGKSTLLGAVIGKVKAERRVLRIDGKDISGLPLWALPHKGIVYVPDGARCFGSLSVEENLRGAYQAVRRDGPAGGFASALEEVYSVFPALAGMRRLNAAALSGGQRQMLAMGRALVTRPAALILDEPSAGLSPKVVEEMFMALDAIKRGRACSILMAEQNVALASAIADDCLVLEEGRVALEGRMGEVVRDERLRAAYLGL